MEDLSKYIPNQEISTHQNHLKTVPSFDGLLETLSRELNMETGTSLLAQEQQKMF